MLAMAISLQFRRTIKQSFNCIVDLAAETVNPQGCKQLRS